MDLRLTVLSENTAGSGGFLAEWGLSILLETASTSVLMDTGTSVSTVYNAGILGINLSNIEKLVLSHGHYDHTGGLRDVLRQVKKKIDIIAHPDIWQLKYSRFKNAPERFIGIPFRQEELEGLGARFSLVREPVSIAENIMTTGEIPMVTEYEAVDAGLFIKHDSGFQPDPVMDDQAVIVKTGQGLVIVMGCAHRGMINTIYHAQKITGISEIQAVIGGSHLINASEERLWQSIAELKNLGVQKLGLCHCTDLPAISLLAQEFGENFVFIKSGTRLEFA